jgi:hypothetical protein
LLVSQEMLVHKRITFLGSTGLKGGIMKRIVSAIAVCFFLLSGVAVAFDSGHIYRNGRVDAVSLNRITIAGTTYKIDPRCKFVIRYEANDSIHERPATFGDVHTGDSVTAKEIGAVIYKINIERWRR